LGAQDGVSTFFFGTLHSINGAGATGRASVEFIGLAPAPNGFANRGSLALPSLNF
jgi:hypothetical protein